MPTRHLTTVKILAQVGVVLVASVCLAPGPGQRGRQA